jgi:integrase
VKSERYGSGARYRARYVGPDGAEKSKSFPDRQKRLADQWLAHTEADMARGQYIDPRAARVAFQQYAETWVSTQGTDPNTQASMESQLRLHAFPYLGSRPLGSFQPAHIRDWVRQLSENGIRGSYARTIYSNVRAALSAAVDDGHLPRNPCAARSVRPLTVDDRRVAPWTPERVFAVRDGMPERSRAMVDLGGGCGLRQGEILGVAVDAIDFESDTLHVVQQLKLSRSKAVFAPPKGGKLRDVPLPGPVADAIRTHMKRFPPVDITLPWKVADGPLITKRLNLHRAARWSRLADVAQRGGVEAGAGCGWCDPRAEAWRAVHRVSRERHARAPKLLRLGAPGRRREHQGSRRVPGPLGPGPDAPRVRAPHAVKPGAY